MSYPIESNCVYGGRMNAEKNRLRGFLSAFFTGCKADKKGFGVQGSEKNGCRGLMAAGPFRLCGKNPRIMGSFPAVPLNPELWLLNPEPC
jgi:hypothetical protein